MSLRMGPAVYRKVEDLYEAMLADSQPVQNGQHLWEGYTTKLCAEIRVPAGYQHDVMKMLEGMGCATRLRRGDQKGPSRYLLLRPPSEDAYKNYRINMGKDSNTLTKLRQRVRTLEEKVSALEAANDTHDRMRWTT